MRHGLVLQSISTAVLLARPHASDAQEGAAGLLGPLAAVHVLDVIGQAVVAGGT